MHVVPRWFRFLIGIILCLPAEAEVVPPKFRTLQTQSGNGPFFITQVAVDSAGNTLWAGGFTGSTASIGLFSLTNSGPLWTADACIFKFGPDFDERWTLSGGGPGEQSITGLAMNENRDCHFALTVSTNTTTFDGLTFSSPSNHFTVVFKYSRGGARIWHHQIDGITTDGWNKTVAVDNSANVYFGGTYADNRSFLRKLSPMGGVLWTRPGDKIQTALSYSLQTDSIGNCYSLSSFTNATVTFGPTTLQNRGRQNYVLVKHDPAGNVLWARRGGGNGPGEDYGIDVSVDSAGDVYVLSVIRSTNFLFGTNDIHFTQPGNWVLAKYSSNSQPLWSQAIPTPHILEIGGLSLDKDGLLISASSYYGEEYSSGFLAKCSFDGELLWLKRLKDCASGDGVAVRWQTRLIAANNNRVYVAGADTLSVTGGCMELDTLSLPAYSLFLAALSYDPQLSILPGNNEVMLSWPTNEAGFDLEISDGVGPGFWQTSTNPVTLQNGKFSVLDPAPATNRFYRLRKALP